MTAKLSKRTRHGKMVVLVVKYRCFRPKHNKNTPNHIDSGRLCLVWYELRGIGYILMQLSI